MRAEPSVGPRNATGPLAVQSGRLIGAVRIDRTRNVSQWCLVATSIAADRGRDPIAILGGTNSTLDNPHGLRLGPADRAVGPIGEPDPG